MATEPYVLVLPTYGGTGGEGSVPKQVIRFLNDPQNRQLIRGVIGAGNTNFRGQLLHGRRTSSPPNARSRTYTDSNSWARRKTSPAYNKDWKSFGHDCRRHRSNQVRRQGTAPWKRAAAVEKQEKQAMPAAYKGLGYHELNAMLNLYGPNGEIQFEADREAAHEYFLQHVNQNTVFFHDLEEKLDYLVKKEYYERETLDQYTMNFIRELYDLAYSKKFRFETFLGAFKYYTSLHAEDVRRQALPGALRGPRRAWPPCTWPAATRSSPLQLVDEIIEGRFQPATPTFLNAGKAQRGELVSCFLLRIEDNMESIGRGINSALQLSKRGGGVALAADQHPRGRRADQADREPVLRHHPRDEAPRGQLHLRQPARCPPGCRCGVPERAPPGHLPVPRHQARERRREDPHQDALARRRRSRTSRSSWPRTTRTCTCSRRTTSRSVYGMPFGDISVTEKYCEMVDDSRHQEDQDQGARVLPDPRRDPVRVRLPVHHVRGHREPGKPDQGQDQHVQPVLRDPAGLTRRRRTTRTSPTTRSARTSPATSAR